MGSTARALLCFAAAAGLAGCYDDHSDDARADSGTLVLLDGGSARDVGSPPDGGPLPDTPGPLPVEPEPDPLPDERPTGAWTDVLPPPSDAPVLEPVGDRIPLEDATVAGGPPALVWNGEGWGVAWDGYWHGLRFAVLDADGRLLRGPMLAPSRRGWISLDFAVGRYVLVSTSGTASSYDRAATPVVPSAFLRGAGADVARFPVAHRWLVASTSEAGGRIDVFTLDDRLSPTPNVTVGSGSSGDARVATATTRALVAWTTETAIHGRVLRGAALEPVTDDLELIPLLPQLQDSGAEVELFRDRFVVAAQGASNVEASLVDPFSDPPTVSPAVIVGATGIRNSRPGIAVAPEHGFFVVCYATGPGERAGSGDHEDGVALRVLGADGTPWGTPLQLVSGEVNVGGTACGWNGTDIVVVWWRRSADGFVNSILSERVRPTFL